MITDNHHLKKHICGQIAAADLEIKKKMPE